MITLAEAYSGRKINEKLKTCIRRGIRNNGKKKRGNAAAKSGSAIEHWGTEKETGVQGEQKRRK